VADHHSQHLLSELDPKDPVFPGQGLAWAFQAKCEIMDLVLGSEDEIAASRALMAEADRILARKWIGGQTSFS
jgi:hypothetical protein